ncbi:hypothetical protein Acr_27g0003320 [Actinidia rufa]|uniref:Retrotransposon Copia-like N-terminal domain-containing protein n=1 Tax=Actinidia rufa TaxID=165716 RepID=A0A7J0H669_9ERIC|nr:hypothetical protein Acr_27g0003320 [Actinidia rufa]
MNPSLGWAHSTYNPSPHSAFTAAQTLNPTATNAATTPNLCATNNQPLCNQQPPRAAQQPPLRSLCPDSPVLHSPCATTPVQPAATPCSPVLHSPCAATPVQPAAQSSSHPALRNQQPADTSCIPAPAQCSPVQPLFLKLILGVIMVMANSLKEVALTHMVPSPVLVSLSHSQPTQRVTSVLLNGKNFHAWSRSFQLYPSGKRKTRWILGKEPKPAEAPTALHGKSGHPTWILDYGANNHMTGELATFTSPVTSVNQSVCIADGSSIPIRSQGDARLSSDITLSSVYHVPHFAYNLLSVSRLAKDLNCAVVFLPSRCYLQDLSSKKIFGRGYERDGLYYFGDPLPSHVTFLETVLFFSDSTPSPDPGSEILAADDPIPPRPLPILESPSSPFASQDPSPRA